MRILKHSINIVNKEEVVIPLMQAAAVFLGVLLWHVPIPLPLRMFDLIPMLLRRVAIQLDILEEEQATRASATLPTEQIWEVMFMAAILRLTGHVMHFYEYWRDW